MSKEVKRYGMCGFESGIIEMEDGPYVDADAYDALLDENKRLESAWKVDVLNRKDQLIAKQEKENDRVKGERDALLAERDAEWISAETLPAYPDAEITYEAREYLVTNGYTVGICDFERGHGCGQPWAAWGSYGSLKPSEITHWKPLPAPPALQGEQP